MSQHREIRDVLLSDAELIREIYQKHVIGSSTSFELTVPTVSDFHERIQTANERRPWIVMADNDRLCGYAYASPFRSREAYQFTIETTVYVHHDFQRQGIGQTLMGNLLSRLRGLGYHIAIAGVTLPNPGSVGLHERLGFRKVGVFPEVGRKYDQWHDVGFWSLKLSEDLADDTVHRRTPE